MKTIFIERQLEAGIADSFRRFAELLGIRPEMCPHVTLIYSNTRVDHTNPAFALRKNPITITPKDLSFDRFGDCIVLCFTSPEISARHAELRAAGASWDYPDFNAHITIGHASPDQPVKLPDNPFLNGPIGLMPETMKLVGPDKAGPAPEIARYGYQLDNIATFLDRASETTISAYRQNCVGNGDGEFIIWDPLDGNQGFMVCGPEIADLNREFLSTFGLDTTTEANP
ncbi:hypothetical protein [Leisingera caerulea]|uniref:hypothetical protein n=1 Tax=Leisingera caerulea TaxID=506591 RepID=UPI0004857EE0|nr:hypothetical protein [Leisingera caerulea]